MDKHHGTKSKKKFMKYLPKAMSFGHRVPPFSPGRDLHHHHNNSMAANKTFFSGPMVPLVPNEARVRRPKNDTVWDEPTSPKVSCIGQIKLAKVKRSPRKKTGSGPPLIPKNTKTSSSDKNTKTSSDKNTKTSSSSKFKRFFSAASKTSSRNSPSGTVVTEIVTSGAAPVPSLGEMKKFASSRDVLGGFDWTVEMKSEESPVDHQRGYYSDDDRRGGYDHDDDEDDDDHIIIPFSAPLSLKPKKEVNLWKRRTMDPPKPLHLQSS